MHILAYMVSVFISGYLVLYALSGLWAGIEATEFLEMLKYIALKSFIGGVVTSFIQIADAISTKKITVLGCALSCLSCPLWFLLWVVMACVQTFTDTTPFPVKELRWFIVPFIIGFLQFIPVLITQLFVLKGGISRSQGP